MQQVDLYLRELRPKRELFSALNVALAVVVFCAALSSLSISSFSKIGDLNAQAEASKKELEKMTEMIAMLKKKSLQNDRKSIERQLLKLQKIRDKKEQLVAAFNGEQLGNDFGFSRLLMHLAKHSHQELSLEKFHLLQGGRAIELLGQSVVPEAAFEYVDKLIQEREFRDTKFGVLQIKDDGSGAATFSSGELSKDLNGSDLSNSQTNNPLVYSGDLQ